MPAKDLVINAQWSANTYKLTVVFDNGEDTYTKEVVYGMAPEYELPTELTKTGYSFKGWNGNVPTTMPASDVTITALWTINQYSITFDSNGGSPVDTITKDYGSNVNAPVAPTKEGHTFAGWALSETATELVPQDYKIVKDVTLYAKWTKNKYDF